LAPTHGQSHPDQVTGFVLVTGALVPAVACPQGPAVPRSVHLQVAHSWANDAFLGRQGVLDGVATSAHLLPVLIHGRLDISGPLVTAWELHKRWPGSWLVVIDHEGQSGADMNTQVKRETVIICCRC